MARYTATIRWRLDDADTFRASRYSRGHDWTFDGGITVPASASPSVVPLPWSVEQAVDPEEAFVASVSSCHMLWFLSLAAEAGYVVASYVDEAHGVMRKNDAGQLAITGITLRPRTRFAGETRPSPDTLDALHEAAHARCFIANSVRTAIVCRPELE